MSKIDLADAALVLESLWDRLQSHPSPISGPVLSQVEEIFSTKTAAYREALLGCIIAKLVDPEVDIRKPYSAQSNRAFSGRTLDEKVVNPFLKREHIPSSRGPYLSVFRRNIIFDNSVRGGLRDPAVFDAFSKMLSFVEGATDTAEIEALALSILAQFKLLREATNIPLQSLDRLSLESAQRLIARLCKIKSGGRFPLLIAASVFHALIQAFRLDWTIQVQDINESDRASGAAGDISIFEGAKLVIAIEVTERSFERSRLEATFREKISVLGIKNYLILTNTSEIDDSVSSLCRAYFSHGFDIALADYQSWAGDLLATIGTEGRTVFVNAMVQALSKPDTGRDLKVAWNQAITGLME